MKVLVGVLSQEPPYEGLRLSQWAAGVARLLDSRKQTPDATASGKAECERPGSVTSNAVSNVRTLRTRAARLWRSLWPVVIVAAGAITCDAPSGLGRHAAQISIAPDFSSLNLGRFAGLTIDQVRLIAIRPGPPAETLKTETFPFHVDSTQIAINFSVEVSGTEQLEIVYELLAGTQLMFTASQMVTATAGQTTPPPATPVTPVFVGPGSNAGSLIISPRDSGTGFGGTIPFTVTATDSSSNPVASFYVSWSTSGAAASGHAINGAGEFRAGNSRGQMWVHAETPTGIKDSTTVSVTPVPSVVQAFAGNGQVGSAGQPLSQPLVARVLAGDGLPVVGVPVSFAVTSGGGSVLPVTVATDTAGRAATQATLGQSGAQSFSATVPGVAPATFTATIPSSPTIVLSLVGGNSLVGIGTPGGLVVTLTQAAPAGGVTVNLTSDSTAYLLFGTSATAVATIPAGGTRDTVPVDGIALGVARITATATGYTSAQGFFVVSPNYIVLTPGSLNVALSGAASLSVQLSTPAPAGGVAVALSSTDVAIATVTPTVTIASGQTTGTATVTGVAAGTAGILATATGYGQGGAVVTVGGSGTPASIAKTAGDGLTAFINDTTAIRPQVQVLDGAGAPVQGAVVNFLVTSGGGSMPVTSATTNATGFATAGAAWRMGGTPGTNELTAQLPAFPTLLTIFTASAAPPPPIIELSVFGSTVVGQARTGQLDVKLRQPAPVGGVTVNLTTLRPGLLRIGSYASENGTLSFVQGDTLGSIAVFGDSLTTGIDTVVASAPGYTGDSLAVPISINLISLPTTANVPLSQNASLPVNLSVAAPAGGLKVAIASSNPSVVEVLTDTVTINAGSQVGSATVRGAALGSATVTATNPNYAPDQSAVNVTASFNITTGSVSLNASFGSPITIQLESGGQPVAAPAGGVAVTLTPRDPSCAAASAATITQGFVNTTATVTYGGSAPLSCSTYVIASGPAGFGVDSVQASVAVQPAVGMSTMNLGSGLQRPVNVSLGASNHGGTTVQVTSPDPSIVRLSLSDTAPGSASVNVPYAVGTSNATIWVQAMEGRTADTVTLTATATGFVTATPAVRVWQALIDLVGVPGTVNTLSGPSNLYVRTWTPNVPGPSGVQSNNDQIRAGGVAVTARISATDSAVARLVDTASVFTQADTAYVTIRPLEYNSATTLAQGGAQLQYLATGVDTVRAFAAGYRSVGSAVNDVVTVTAPSLSIGTMNLGSGLQRAINLNMSAAAPAGGVTVQLAVDRLGFIKLAPSDTSTVGVDTLLVTIPQGFSNATYYVQALEGIVADTVRVTATAVAPGFTAVNPDTAEVRVWQALIDLVGVPSTVNTLSGPSNLYVRTWTPNVPGPSGVQSNNDQIRAGGVAVTARISATDSAVARLVDTASVFTQADTAYVTIRPLEYNSATTLAQGGAQLQYLATGVDTVRAFAAGYRSVGSAVNDVVTVTAPSLSIGTMNLGSGLQRAINLNMSAAAPAGGVTVQLAVDRLGFIKLAPSDTSTVGVDTLLVTIPQGFSNATYYVQALEGIVADTVRVTATAVAPGFTAVNPDTAEVRVWQPLIDLVGVVNNPNTLRANDIMYARSWTPNVPGPTGVQSNNDQVRAGGNGFTVSFSTAQPTVAQLETQTDLGDTVTATIAPRQYNTPTTRATGGVEVNYLSTGVTAIKASAPGARSVGVALTGDTITISPPVVSLNNTTVGLGLQTGTSGFLSASNHGGITVVVKSSNPAVARISPDAATPGTDSIVINLANGFSSFNYHVQGIEGSPGGLVNITASATGFSPGNSTANVVSTVFDVVSVVTSASAASSAVNAFYARIWTNGNPSGQPQLGQNQAVRAGGVPLTVTFNTSNPAVATLVTAAGPQGGTASATINPGEFNTPGSLASGGVGQDFLTQGITNLTVSIPGVAWVGVQPIVVNVGP